MTFEQARVRWASVYMILTFLARQGGLTRLDYCFHVNAYKHLTAEGLHAAVIQLGLKTVGKSILLELEELTGSENRATEFFCAGVGELNCNFWQY